MTLLDTSVLVDAFSGREPPAPELRRALERGERFLIPALVMYEWLRGPRRPEEVAAQEALFPARDSLVFGPKEAAVAADLYLRVRRPRGREMDLAIAACAIIHEARIWTLNPKDFRDVPGLDVSEPLRGSGSSGCDTRRRCRGVVARIHGAGITTRTGGRDGVGTRQPGT